MKGILVFGGTEFTEQDFHAAQEWLLREQIPGMAFTAMTPRAKPGEMGGELASILSVVLGSAAVVQLVKSLQIWVQTRKKKLFIELQINTRTIKIDVDNPKDPEAVILEAINAFKNHDAV